MFVRINLNASAKMDFGSFRTYTPFLSILDFTLGIIPRIGKDDIFLISSSDWMVSFKKSLKYVYITPKNKPKNPPKIRMIGFLGLTG